DYYCQVWDLNSHHLLF
nr:immunoglobulin light chain junction region [Macaca mulatta]MOV65975.1 immunoglobulin light chain junction region [Macaca mulatta]MOV66017.1 immunoglobulin light chain junction region [Macaca mulatta]MOV66095.1 immunoglobulin light chain junction region [Macaca mulatta]MOV66291.1 immunoglobulin light chain junction region [Macaca mulatta]